MEGQTYYPIVLTRLKGRRVVVFGGGAVAERKTRGLLAADAAVTLISPQATLPLKDLAAQGRIVWERRVYQPGDCFGAALTFAATNVREVNQNIAQESERANILCNVADDPARASFHLPAVYRGEEHLIAVSAYGANPAGAKKIRDEIAKWFGGKNER